MTIKEIALAAAVALAAAAPARAQTETTFADRLSVGTGVPGTSPAVGSVRLSGLGTSGGTEVLFTDANRDVIRRALAKADLPAAIAYEDEANTFTQTNVFTPNQTFSADIAVNGGDITSSTALIIRPTGNLTLDPTGDVIIGADGLDVLPATGYTYNLGALTNKYLTLHAAELWVETLVAQNTIATIGGRILVGPTTTLTSDLASGATSMVVKHNQMANGDRVYLEANGSVEWIAIASAPSGSGPYTYTITRNLDGSGANNWTAGDAVFNTGTTGKGYIDLYSVSGVLSGSGPTIAFNVRTGSTYNQIATRGAVGNLNGLYGYGAETYGAAFGDSTAANITMDSTNGFRIRNSTTNLLQATAAGNLIVAIGSVTLDSSGIRLTPSTAAAVSRAFYWDSAFARPSSLEPGAFYYENAGGATSSALALDNTATAGDHQWSILAQQTGNASVANMIGQAGDSDADTFLQIVSTWNGGTRQNSIQLGSTGITMASTVAGLTMGNDLQVRFDDSSTNPGMPWIHGDGANLMVNGNESLRLNWDVAGAVLANNFDIVSNGVGTTLQTGYASRMAFAAGLGSPQAGRIYFGDGSGWQLQFRSRTGSTDTTRIWFDDRARIGIGMAPTTALELSTDSAQKPTTSTWTITSDRRSKRNVHAVDSMLAGIRRLNLVEYDYNGQFGTPAGAHGIGAVADEVARVFPRAVRWSERQGERFQTMDWHTIFVANVKAVQELAADVERLRAKVATLEAR